MIITTDLRAAIRSAEKKQPHRHGLPWAVREQRVKDAIAKLAANARFKKRIDAALKKSAAAKKALGEVGVILGALGLSTDSDNGLRVYDEAKFVKTGGKLPVEHKPWSFDTVMAELAAAQPKQAKAILKKYGINWS